MKIAFTNKLNDKAAREGFDPDLVTTGASDTLNKAMTVVATMEKEAATFSKRTSLKRTRQYFQTEYSMMMGYSYSYSATVLATHFIEGSIPTKLKEYKHRPFLGSTVISESYRQWCFRPAKLLMKVSGYAATNIPLL